MLPKNTSRPVRIQALYETVEAATPMDCFIATVEGAWQMRAALSTLLVPRKRATFWAT